MWMMKGEGVRECREKYCPSVLVGHVAPQGSGRNRVMSLANSSSTAPLPICRTYATTELLAFSFPSRINRQ